MSLTKDLEKFLISKGANLVGFADLADLNINKVNKDNLNFKVKSGIVFMKNIPADVVNGIDKGPTKEYLDVYNDLNEKLDIIALEGEKFLESKGKHAYAQTVSRTSTDIVCETDFRNTIPHKTIGTKAGLGWIGKSAMFVTNQYGSAIRLSSILTDANLDYGKPVSASLCGMCTECRNVCPAGAVSGISWNPKLDRDDFFDYKLCRESSIKLTEKLLSTELPICGRCINACPHTQKYIQKSL